MTQAVEEFYSSLLKQENWYIYYIIKDDSMVSSAFVYESETVDYLFNSCRDHTLDEFNTGTYLNDKLLPVSYTHLRAHETQ